MEFSWQGLNDLLGSVGDTAATFYATSEQVKGVTRSPAPPTHGAVPALPQTQIVNTAANTFGISPQAATMLLGAGVVLLLIRLTR